MRHKPYYRCGLCRGPVVALPDRNKWTTSIHFGCEACDALLWYEPTISHYDHMRGEHSMEFTMHGIIELLPATTSGYTSTFLQDTLSGYLEEHRRLYPRLEDKQ